MTVENRLVIGIDPGTAITGYGLVRETNGQLECEDFGVVRTSASDKLEQRLQEIYIGLEEVVKQHKPTDAAVEQLFFHRNVSSAMAVGQGRGVALLVIANAGMTAGDYTPREVKQAVTGYGNAEKLQVQEMVRALLNLESVPHPDDAADALAVAICHAHTLTSHAFLEEQ